MLRLVNLDSIIDEMTSEQRLSYFASEVGRDRVVCWIILHPRKRPLIPRVAASIQSCNRGSSANLRGIPGHALGFSEKELFLDSLLYLKVCSHYGQ